MSLIETILADSKARLEARKQRVPRSELASMASHTPRGTITFRAALEATPFSLVAELKRRSPSSGKMDAGNVDRALSIYDATPSVSAISVLTDEDHFGSKLDDLRAARSRTTKPLLRKDFIVDEYQVLEARAFGADAILIMSGLHVDDPGRVTALLDMARGLGMDVLFEVGMMGLEALPAQRARMNDDAVIWGVNSRRFKTSHVMARARIGAVLGMELSTDMDVHRELRSSLPEGQLRIAESGIKSPGYLRELMDMGYNGALIGTAFLKKGVDVSEVLRGFDREVAAMLVEIPNGRGHSGRLEVSSGRL